MQHIEGTELNELLFEADFYLLKSVKQEDSDLWKFGGIASSEDVDVEGDRILRKSLDLSYIQRRGYVNWDHSRDPSNQIGFTSGANLIEPGSLSRYEDILSAPLSKSSSVYVEGFLYKHVKKAQEVMDIMRSIPSATPGALGLSVEGGMAKNAEGSIVKAIVRGVAVTPVPAHPDTLCRLVKSLSSGVSKEVEHAVVDMAKSVSSGLTFDAAVIRLMELRPRLSLDLAKKVVRYAFAHQQEK